MGAIAPIDDNQIQSELADAIAATRYSPLKYVLLAFDFGNKGELSGHYPRDWQVLELQNIEDRLKSQDKKTHPQVDLEPILNAVASGHGIGKSCLVSWIILWAMSTCIDCKGVVTANTEMQLKTKTWSELAKWWRLSINKDWFKFTATSLFSALPQHEKTWRIDMIPWSENNTEAFAGLHNVGKRILLIFDEASAIPDVIWEVAEGAMTDENTEIIWSVFGNPTRNTGRFKECFGSLRHRWRNNQIDSRTVDGTNKKQLQNWVEDYGEDSDFVRVRVRGVFPRAGDAQFIRSDRVEEAILRTVEVPRSTPRLLGVDIARFGSDQTVFARRHGRKCEPMVKYQGKDTMQVAALVVQEIMDNAIDVTYIDGVGIGAGVVDRVRQLGFNCIEVISGTVPDDENKDLVYNKRCEMWYRMREWIDGADIPDDRELHDDLVGIEYEFDAKHRIKLEKKADMKKRGLASPDCGDALALTFSYAAPMMKSDSRLLVPEHTEDW